MAHRNIRDRELGRNRATQQHIDDRIEADYGPDSRPNRTSAPPAKPPEIVARDGTADPDAQSSVHA